MDGNEGRVAEPQRWQETEGNHKSCPILSGEVVRTGLRRVDLSTDCAGNFFFFFLTFICIYFFAAFIPRP